MSTPYERLLKIVANVTTTRAKYGAKLSGDGRLFLNPIVFQTMKILPNSDPLQEAMSEFISESWNHLQATFEPKTTVVELYDVIKRNVIAEYEHCSERCAATKRKTHSFIAGVQLDDQHLANYLVSLYLEIRSRAWITKPMADKRQHFETLESLRRVYGKR